MSVFKKFLTEKRRRDYGRKGGQGGTRSTSSTPFERRESRSKTQDPSKTTPSRRLGTDKPRVLKSPQGFTITNMPEPTGNVTTDQVVDTFDQKSKKGSPRGSGGGFGQSKADAARYAGKPDAAQQAAAADDIRGRKGTDPTARKAASNVLGGGRKTPPGEELIGGETAKPGRGQRYRQRRPSEVRGSGKTDPRLRRAADAIIKDLRADAKIDAERASAQSRGTASRLRTRMSAGYDKNLKATADKVLKQIQGTKGVSQADVSKRQQQYRIKYKEAQLTNKVKPQTKAKVKALLPSPGQTSAPAQPTTTKRPKNAASVQTSTVKAGGNLEFGKTKTGSFTYSGASSTNPAVSKAVKTSKVQVAPFKELPAGNTTVKVGDSTKRLNRIKSMKSRQVPAQTGRSATFKTADPTAASGSTFKSTTPQKVADLGKGTNVRGGQSATIRGSASSVKPPKMGFDPKKVKQRAKKIHAIRQHTVRSPLGRVRQVSKFATGGALLDAGITAGLELYDKSQANKAAGGSGALSTKDKARAIVRGIAGATGFATGAAAAAPIAAAPVPGARPAAFAAGMYTGSKASDWAVKQADKAFDASYDTIAGATKWQKKQMEKINRQNQGAGVSAQQASFKKGDRAIIRDADGKERIGYAAKLTGKDGVTKTVYKHANDPKAQRYTSSSPLERIGRALMPGRYAAKDEAARKKRVADFKKAALATEQYFTFLHITESMIAQGYDAEFIKEFWGWEDVKQVEFVNSLDLIEDIFIPDEEFLTESNDLSEGLVKWIDRMIRRMKTKRVPTPTQTSSGRPITSSGTGAKGNANVTSSGTPITGSSSVTPPKQTPKLADKVKTVLNNPKVRTAGLTAAGAGLVTLGGKLALDNNIIPSIPDTPDTKDSDTDPKDPKETPAPKGPKGPVLTGPDGKPVQFPPLTPPPPVPKSREVLRSGHWRAINDPPQFHRDPALADYRNIRATRRR